MLLDNISVERFSGSPLRNLGWSPGCRDFGECPYNLAPSAPFNAMLFDRLVAATRTVGTAGFLIYVADASGYAGSVVLTLLRNLPGVTLNWLHFYIWLAYAGAATCLVMGLASALYFARRLARPGLSRQGRR